jgi:uncharacterized protein YecE (DUF72 family)
VTLACANALRAKTILFQSPASFKPTKENIANLEEFFSRLERDNGSGGQFHFCWEPRGDWDSKVVKSLCERLNLWHAVDPFVNESVTPGSLYFRLHGRGGWRYVYEEDELRELAAILAEPSAEDKQPYVFFNNVRMTEDALRFRKIIGE